MLYTDKTRLSSRLVSWNVFMRFGLITLLIVGLFSASAFAQTAEATQDTKVLESAENLGPGYAISMYGEPALSKGFSHLSYANPDATKGGAIAYGVVGSFDNVNPFILKSMRSTARGLWDPEFGHLYFQSLMMRSQDEPFTLYGLLAEKAEMPEDRSWIEFTLNPNAKWHDGMPVTPEDVIYTYDVLTEKARPPFSTRTKRIRSIEKTGDLKVKFTFNEDSNREFPLIIAGFTPVLPKHAIERETFENSTLTPMIGSGPYKISSIEVGKQIKFEKDPNYWGKDLPVMKGLFNFDNVTIEYFRQQNTLFEAFKKGIIDVFAEGDPAKWQRNYDFESVANGDVIKGEFTSDDPATMSGFVFNTRRPIFEDKAVRQAIAMAFDFETVNKNLFFGAYTRTQSFWHGSDLSSIGKPANEIEKQLLADFPGAVQTDIMDGTWRLPVTDARGGDRKILRETFKRLQKAGYSRKDGLLVGPDGTALSFEIMTRNLSEEKIALSFKATLKRLGVTVEIRSVDDAQYQQRLNTFDYDMVIAGYSASLSPGIEQNWRWSSDAKSSEGSFNYSGTAEPVINYLIQKIVEAKGSDEFVAAVRAFDRVLLSGHYIIPLYHLDKQWIAYRSYLGHPEKTALYGNRFPTWWHKKAN
jgi:peptide/nickel transport system substrate-binding protein